MGSDPDGALGLPVQGEKQAELAEKRKAAIEAMQRQKEENAKLAQLARRTAGAARPKPAGPLSEVFGQQSPCLRADVLA